MTEPRWGAIAGWAVDCLHAARERPLWARVLLRVALGRYAYREFLGLQDELARSGLSPYLGYGCQNQRYHEDACPWEWWLERTPKPLPEPAPVAPPPPALLPAPSVPAVTPLSPALMDLALQHAAHNTQEVQAMQRLGILDQEFYALVNLALPQMSAEHQAQFHSWSYRRQMTIEDISEAITARGRDFESLFTEINRTHGQH